MTCWSGDTRSPDGAKRNPGMLRRTRTSGPQFKTQGWTRISLRFIRATILVSEARLRALPLDVLLFRNLHVLALGSAAGNAHLIAGGHTFSRPYHDAVVA